MSYGFDLIRLPAGLDRHKAYHQKMEELKRTSDKAPDSADLDSIDPNKEQLKQRLASDLIARHPTLELYKRDYFGIAKARGITEAEARRLFRTVELNEEKLWIQILIFDEGAGASFSFVGEAHACIHALRVLWDCLEILESVGGFSTYDTQLGKILDLKHDFEVVLQFACGVE